MKKIFIGMVIGAVSISSVFAECTLGAMSIDAVGGPLPSSNPLDYVNYTSQKIKTYTANFSLESSATTSTPKSLPLNSQIVAFEYKVIKPTGLTGNEVAAGWARHFSPTNGGLLITPISNNNGGIAMLFGSGDHLPTTRVDEQIPNASNRFGVYINKQTKQVGYILNGVNKGYQWSYTNPITELSFMIASGFDGFLSTSTKLNQEVSIELITDSEKLEYSYPTGTTDICGTML